MGKPVNKRKREESDSEEETSASSEDISKEERERLVDLVSGTALALKPSSTSTDAVWQHIVSIVAQKRAGIKAVTEAECRAKAFCKLRPDPEAKLLRSALDFLSKEGQSSPSTFPDYLRMEKAELNKLSEVRQAKQKAKAEARKHRQSGKKKKKAKQAEGLAKGVEEADKRNQGPEGGAGGGSGLGA